LNFKP